VSDAIKTPNLGIKIGSSFSEKASFFGYSGIDFEWPSDHEIIF
jgi:hypothetical protein